MIMWEKYGDNNPILLKEIVSRGGGSCTFNARDDIIIRTSDEVSV